MMKIANITVSLLLAACVLIGVGGAGAADITITFNGNSAQFYLWSTLNSGTLPTTPNFLLDTVSNGGAGCASAYYHFDSAGSNYFWARGYTCSGFSGDNINIIIKYKTSNDGIWSVMGAKDPEDSAACTLGTQRKLPSVWPGDNNTAWSSTTPPSLTCQDITLGMSDEAAKYFTQQSSGHKSGAYPKGNGTNSIVKRCFGATGAVCKFDGTTAAEPMPDDTNLNHYITIADPTAFYVNKAVTLRTCVAGSRAGDMCSADSQCPGSTCGTATTLDNVSSTMAAQIFTGQAIYWTDFGAGFPANLPIYACMRHTGAGTNVTFDYAVLAHTHNWLPAGLGDMMQVENTDLNVGPYAYFYDSIASQLDCVNGIISVATDPTVGTPPGSNGSAIGAIGFTDADRSTTFTTSSNPNVAMTKYNGVWPSRRNMRNGLYDFYNKNYLYYNPTNNPVGGTNYAVFNALVAYANDPAKFNNFSSGKGSFWATIGEMVFDRPSADQVPKYVTGATQTP